MQLLLGGALVFGLACDEEEAPPATREAPAPAPAQPPSAPAPPAPPALEPLIATAVFAGHDSTCANVADEGLVCWGRGWAPDVSPRMPRAMGIDDVVAASLEGAHACAVDGAGVARCWGDGIRGELGNGERAAPGATVTAAISDVTGVGVSNGATCLLEREGTVRCAGAYGQVGRSDEVASVELVPVEGIDDAEQLVSGWQHYCVRRRGGRVACWGSGQMGQLGQGDESDAAAPVEVPRLRGIVDLTAGAQFTCALDAEGTVTCWGANWFGQLGDGDLERCHAYGGKPCRTSPTTLPATTPEVVDLEAGSHHVCARHRDGSVSCWGLAADGAIGAVSDDAAICPERTGNDAHCVRPVPLAGLANVVQLAAGQKHTCARTEDGEVLCWGSNDQQQLGTHSDARPARVYAPH